jgi:hypothetical protein
MSEEKGEKKMNYFLYGGAPSVGKSESIARLVDWLIKSKHFKPSNLISLPGNDFYYVLEGTDKNGKKIKVIVSSAADTPKIVDGFKIYCANNTPYDSVISSIRDSGDFMRTYFQNIMNITGKDICLEIPLAKITRRNIFGAALQWYRNTIDALSQLAIGQAPFLI